MEKKKSERLLLQEQYLITSNTFQFESVTSRAKNASSIVLSHTEVLKNWSKTYSRRSTEELFLSKLTQCFRVIIEKERLVKLYLKECRKPKSKMYK